MKHSCNIGLLICNLIFLLLIAPREAALFQRSTFEGHNMCVDDMPDFPVKTWLSMNKLTTDPTITLEMKECSIYCLLDPKCITFQIVRMDNGKGFCYILYTMNYMIFIEESTCQNFVKQNKKWECIIQWNPANYNSKSNMVGYRVRKTDNSWAIYNNSRGIHTLELNATTCLPSKHLRFDTFGASSELTKFQNYVDKQGPIGTYVIGFSVGNFYTYATSTYIFKKFNVAYENTATYSLAFILVKGRPLDVFLQTEAGDLGYGLLIIVTEKSKATFSTFSKSSKDHFLRIYGE